MSKFQKLIKTISLLLKQPSLINLIIDSDQRWQQHLNKNHNNIKSLPIVDIEALLPNFNENLTVFSFLGGGSLPTDIMLLKGLAENINDCSYFEIGTWRGESVVNVSETAKECYTLNLSSEQMTSLGWDEQYIKLHAFYSKNKENVTHLFGDSMEYNFGKLNKKFDLIFIDGNHTYEFVKNDTEKVFEHLVHENTIVVWHDYAYTPEEIRPSVLAGILDGVPKEKKNNVYHVSNTMCAIYTPQKLNAKEFRSPSKPNKYFTTSAELIKIK